MFTNNNGNDNDNIQMTNNEPTDAINLLLGLGKMGTRVQVLKENGDLYPDQLFFKSLTSRRLSWNDNKKSIIINPYILVLPGKITGLLSIAPSVNDIPDQLCLGIVSKDYVLEIIFQNARDCNIWSQGLTMLVSAPLPHFAKIKNISNEYEHHRSSSNHSTSWNGNDIIQWHEITMDEKKKIEQFYNFLSNSDKGSVFYQYQTLKKTKLPQKVLIKLNEYGDQLLVIHSNNNLINSINIDSLINIVDPKHDTNDKKEEDKTDKLQHFRHAPSSMHCFSMIRNEIEIHLGCSDIEQYKLWRFGLEYLCNKRNHLIRMRARRAILAGDLILSTNNQLIESPKRGNTTHHHQKEDSSSKSSSSFWGSLFG